MSLKVLDALSARAAFGERFAYHSAMQSGLELGFVRALFHRPLSQTREQALALGKPNDRRSTPRPC